MITKKYNIEGAERPLAVLTEREMHCTVGGANKFWEAVLGRDLSTISDMPYIVILRWGKIGTTGQDQNKRFRSQIAAHQYLAGRIRDKNVKGYVLVNGGADTVGVIKPQAAIPYVETEWDLL